MSEHQLPRIAMVLETREDSVFLQDLRRRLVEGKLFLRFPETVNRLGKSVSDVLVIDDVRERNAGEEPTETATTSSYKGGPAA